MRPIALPAVEREREVERSKRAEMVVVVGDGPAGGVLQIARDGLVACPSNPNIVPERARLPDFASFGSTITRAHF